MANITKKDKKYLNEITELTPENFAMINSIFEKGIPTRQIYSNLSDSIKRNPKILDLCIKNINQSGLKATLKLITEATSLSEDDFLKMANKYHPGLVASYAIKYKLGTDKLIELMLDNEETKKEIVKKILYNKEYSKEEKNKIYENSETWVMDRKPVQYIKLSPNIKFKGREDYLKLVNAYLVENSSTVKFCNKYFIDKKEFNSVLDILSQEDKELGEQIDETKEKASQRYMELMKDLVKKVTNEETTLKEVIDLGNGRINGWDFINSSSFTSKEQHTKLLIKMLEEINSNNEEKPKDKLDLKYDLPQIGGFSIEELGKWFDTEKGHPVEDIYSALGMINGRMAYLGTEYGKNKMLSQALLKTSKLYGGDFSTERIKNTFFENPETKARKDISNKNVQDALAILQANNKIPSYRLTMSLIKDIAYDKISENEINESYRIVKTRELKEKGKIEKRKRGMANLKNIDEYINYINSPQAELENQQGEREDIEG